MTNLALTLDDDTIAGLRRMAERRGVSVEVIVAEALAEMAANDADEIAGLRFSEKQHEQIRQGLADARNGRIMSQEQVRENYERSKRGE
jgi:predicted transcriptional regulator